MNDLVAAFNEYFEVISADTPQLMQEVFRLRYQVLCVEQRLPGFNASNYADGLEKDDDDYRSVYVLMRHRPSKAYIGTARLLLADPSNLHKPFPVEQKAEFDPELIDVTKLSRKNTAEISRFAILSRFPHHKGGRRTDRRTDITRGNLEVVNNEEKINKSKRRFPHPFLALGVGIIRMCAENNIVHWFSAMDPALNRLFSLYGVHFKPIGPPTDYHGVCRPYFVDLIDILTRTYAHHRDVWELLTINGKVWPAALERRSMPREARNEPALTSEPSLSF
jgi:N-acyl amino acid synthase of PEP-CTERM/exosortase system